MSLQILLSYLVRMCIWTTLFHAHERFELGVRVQVSKSATAIQTKLLTAVSLQILLSYLVRMCIWTRPFHAHTMFDPSDLNLELRVRVKILKSIMWLSPPSVRPSVHPGHYSLLHYKH